MSARRQEEDDEADVDVEVASNDSNGMHVDAPSADLAPDTHTLPGKISSNTMDVTDGSHHTAPVSGKSADPSHLLSTESNDATQEGLPKKVKTDLDFELENKYSQIWGELKGRFTNRHFLKSGLALLQAQREAQPSGSEGSGEIHVGGMTFFTSDTPILDLFLGMTPDPDEKVASVKD